MPSEYAEYLYVKTVEYLNSLETEHLMAGSVIYQGLDEIPWVGKKELKGIVEKAVSVYLENAYNIDSERSEKLL